MAKFAIFTPTHDDQFIMEAYTSLKKQAFKDWCWVIVPNGKKGTVPQPIVDDKRVIVIPWPEQGNMMFGTNIGALKGFACRHIIDNNLGEILVELDHDDYLTDDCLSRLYDLHIQYPNAGFLSSDCVGFHSDGTSEHFRPIWGWESYQKCINGHVWTAMRNFPVTARSLCEIYYCPNHVRCWTKDAYLKSGGHSPFMKVIDDHDLICRTYLAGVEFRHVDDVLYMYRRHPGATTSTDNALIQKQQIEVRDKYLLPLIKEWCRREGLPMYDLGGAHNPEDGFMTLDIHNADVIHNVLEGRWMPDSSIGCIRCSDFIEHIPIPNVVEFVNNVYRQLVPGGWWLTFTPSTDGRGAFCDPTHVSFWNELNFRYYTDAQYAKYVPAIKAKFQQVRLTTVFPTQWHRENNIPYVVSDMTALKGQRQPGMQLF